MNTPFALLLLSTVSVGAVHTLIGPDHYLPFIALSRSRSWSIKKTLTITGLCGIGHILSAVVLGLLAAWFGSAIIKLDMLEGARGQVAAWLLTAFGFVYGVWGLRSAIKNRTHSHSHAHTGGIAHEHNHTHQTDHCHPHASAEKKELTPWVLFIIFIFGPCEPLIPLVMYPAVQASALNVLLVILVFGFATLAVMLTVVTASSFGLKKLTAFPFFERWGNALSGSILCSCGLAMTLLGL